jgi:hypothetical protein
VFFTCHEHATYHRAEKKAELPEDMLELEVLSKRRATLCVVDRSDYEDLGAVGLE